MKRILLIDDDKHEHMFVNFLLQDFYKQAFKLSYASDIGDAKAVLGRERVDMILLDDKLADGTTSADSIPKLQKTAFNVPVIIISKNTEGRHLKDRLRNGSNRVINKFDLRKALASGLLE